MKKTLLESLQAASSLSTLSRGGVSTSISGGVSASISRGVSTAVLGGVSVWAVVWSASSVVGLMSCRFYRTSVHMQALER